MKKLMVGEVIRTGKLCEGSENATNESAAYEFALRSHGISNGNKVEIRLSDDEEALPIGYTKNILEGRAKFHVLDVEELVGESEYD